MELRWRGKAGTFAGMALFEIKTEIPFTAAEAADTTLLEHGLENWSVLEDVIVQRAWLVGIFADESEAAQGWATVTPLLVDAGVAIVGEPVRRSHKRSKPSATDRVSIRRAIAASARPCRRPNRRRHSRASPATTRSEERRVGKECRL